MLNSTIKLSLMKFFFSLMPNRVKKIVVMSSFYSHLLRLKDNDFQGSNYAKLKNIIKKFNELLSMSDTYKTLVLPMYLESLIWYKLYSTSNSVVVAKLNDNGEYDIEKLTYTVYDIPMLYKNGKLDEVKLLLDYIFDSIPSSLIYSSKTVIIKDLLKIVEYIVVTNREVSNIRDFVHI